MDNASSADSDNAESIASTFIFRRRRDKPDPLESGLVSVSVDIHGEDNPIDKFRQQDTRDISADRFESNVMPPGFDVVRRHLHGDTPYLPHSDSVGQVGSDKLGIEISAGGGESLSAIGFGCDNISLLVGRVDIRSRRRHEISAVGTERTLQNTDGAVEYKPPS